MTQTTAGAATATALLRPEDFQRLIDALKLRRFSVVGPTLRDGAIVYGEIDSVEDLPAGWTDVQDAGKYGVKRRKDKALFGYVVGPKSLKNWLYPPSLLLWQARREGREFRYTEAQEKPSRRAFIGVRSCELEAVRIHDKVFQDGPYSDTHYRLRREGAFIVAVNCVQAGGTCFCTSMNTGPRVRGDFDLALTEIVEKNRHYLVVEAGSPAGASVLKDLPHSPAGDEECKKAEAAVAAAAKRMGRSLETKDLKETLYRNLEHSSWDEVGKRCLACANCTMVCPTCFCSTVEDVTDLTGEQAERHRKWDSCFTREFSYIYGGHIRRSTRSRYRQWLTHKLATWQDQFGAIGCVGCGRCITWCPVGIDITEEVRTIREGKVT